MKRVNPFAAKANRKSASEARNEIPHPRSSRGLLSIAAVALVLPSILATPAFAELKTWISDAAMANWNLSGNWSPAGVPASTNDVFITNAITGARTITNSLLTTTIANLVMSNSTAFTHRYIVSSNQMFIVTGTGTLGRNAIFQISSVGGGTLLSTGLFNNLTMVSNARIEFGKTSGAGGDALVITGAFSNTSGNFIGGSGAGWQIIFSNNTETVNAGTIEGGRFTGAGSAGTITVAIAGATNTFRNTGTVLLGLGAGALTATRTFTFNSMLVNQGLLSFSNNTTAASGSNIVFIVSRAGHAVTNDTTGTIRLVGLSGSTVTVSTGGETDIRVREGGFVNKGTITSRLELFGAGVGVRTNFISLAAGQVFSNAVGGQVVLESGNAIGHLIIRADRAVNLGTNLLSAGTLIYQTSAAGAGILENAGTILFSGGRLDVVTLTNTASGVLKSTVATMTNLATKTIFNFGTIDAGTAIFHNIGTVVALGSSGQIFGTLTNTGTLILDAGSALRVGTIRNSATAVITNAGAAVLRVAGSFFNERGASSNFFNLAATDVQFFGGGAFTLQLAGADLGATFAGLTNNYAFGALTTTNATTLTLAGSAGVNALYLSNLTVLAGTELNLAGLKIYFSGTTNILGTLTLAGGSVIDLNAPAADDIIFITAGPGTFDYDTAGNWDQGVVATNSNHKALIASGGGVIVTQNTAAAAFTVNTMTVSNASTLVIGRNQTWTGGGTIGNGGTIEFRPGITVTAALTVQSNGVAIGAGTITGVLNNQAGGSVIASNGVLTLSSAPVNAGTILIKTTLNVTPAWTNGAAGTVTLSGGTLTGGVFTVDGTVGGSGTFAADVNIRAGEAVTSSGAGLAFRNTTTISGSIAGDSTVFNVGTFVASGGTVNPTVTNAGTVRVTGPSTLNHSLLNSGTVLLSSTLVVSNLNNFGSGVLSNVTASSIIINGGNFFNKSANSNAFNLASTTVTLQNGSGTLSFDVAGSDFGATLAGFTNNYALSALTITNYTAKLFSAGFNLTGSNAIYLVNLDLLNLGVLDLNGMNIYFTGSTNILGTLVLNGGQIIKIEPPPATDISFVTVGGTQDYDITANWSPAQQATNSVNKVLIASGGGVVVTQNTALAAFTIDTMTVSNASTLALGRNQTWTGGGTIGSGGTVRITSNLTLTAAVTIKSSGTLVGAGTITGLVTGEAGSMLDVTNGALRLLTQPTLNGTLNVRSGGTLNVGGNYVINSGTINLLGGAILGAEMTNFGLIASTGGFISNGFVNAASAFFSATSGVTVVTPDLANFGTVTNTATIIISNTVAGTLGTVTNAGTIRLGLPTGVTAGTLTSGAITNTGTIVGFGTIIGAVLNRNGGLLDVTNGTLRLFSAPVQDGTVRVQTGGTLVVTNAPDAALRDWANAGTLEVLRGTVISGNITNTGTIRGNQAPGTAASGTISANTINSGSMFVTNGILNMMVGLSNAPAGTIDVANDGTLRVDATWVNAGTVLLKGGMITSNQLNNAGTLTISDVAAGTVTISAVLRNSGTVDVASGLFVLVNPAGTTVTNLAGGTFRAGSSDAVRFTVTGAAAASSNDFFNAGTFIFNAGTIAGGAFVNAGTFNAAHTGTGTITILSPSDAPFSNTVSGRIIVNSGTVLSSRTIVNLGVIDTYGVGTNVFGGIPAVGSNFTNAPGGLIINTNSAATLGIRAAGARFLNQGTIVVSNNATINMQNTGGGVGGDTGTEWVNTNTVILGNAVSFGVLNTGTINNDGTIRGTGTINMYYSGGTNIPTPRPIVQSGLGQLIVTNGDLTITHLSLNRLSIDGGTLQVSGGNTLRIFSDRAAATNAILLNSANVRLDGGTIISANVTNNPTGTIRGFGTLSFNNGPLPGLVSNLHNAGTILANNPGAPLVLDGAWVFNQTNGTLRADSGRLLVQGVFTNRGTLNFLNSVGTFNGVVVNQGAWITDPTTNVFNSDLFVDTNGYISAAAGDVYIFKSNFVNISTRSNDYNTLNTKFIFDGGTNLTLGNSYTQAFYVAGRDMLGSNLVPVGPITPTNAFMGSYADPIFGFSNNFALGTLEIGNPGTNTALILLDSFGTVGTNDGFVAALYLDTLTLFGSSFLIISNNVQLYWKTTNNVYLDGPSQNVFLLGNAGIHQLSVIPEPSVLMFLLIGGLAIATHRNRKRHATLK